MLEAKQYMDVPPIILQGSGQSPAVPPKLADVPPKITQAQPHQATSAPPTSPAAPVLPAAAPKQNPLRAAIAPRQRTRIALGAALCLLLVGVGVYVNRTYCAPRNSVLALASAIGRRDRDTVKEYVDAPALAESLRRYAFENYKLATTKNATNLLDRLFEPMLDRIASGVVGVTYTPESVIGMLCGDDPTELMKEGIGNSSDKTVDEITKDGSPKTKVYGAVGKVLIRWATGLAIDA